MEMILSSGKLMVSSDTEFEKSFMEQMDKRVYRARLNHGLNHEVVGLYLEEIEEKKATVITGEKNDLKKHM